MSKVTSANSASLTGWIPTTEAAEVIRDLVSRGVYAKDELKKSSCKWADASDHSKGYLCRVLALRGLHPELEQSGVTARRGPKPANPVPASPKAPEAPKPTIEKPKGRYTVDVKVEDGHYTILKALEDDSAWFIVDDFEGLKTERAFGSDVNAAFEAFYGSKEEARKHMWINSSVA